MSREAEIVAAVERLVNDLREIYRLQELDSDEFRRVLTRKAQPKAREFVSNAITHMPLVHRFVHNRMQDDIDEAVAKAIDQALDQLETSRS